LSENITLLIEKFVPPGQGLGFYRNKAVFVPLTLPGDLVEIGIEKEKKRHIIGRLERVLLPGPRRREAPCPHYRDCGGCDLLHLDYADQLEMKLAVLKEVLAGFGIELGFPPLLQPAAKEGAGGRHRARFHYDPESGFFGFKPRRRHRVVRIGNCRALAPGLKKLYALLDRGVDIPLSTTAIQGLAAAAGDFAAALVWGRKFGPLVGVPETVVENYGFGKLELAASGFAQVNPEITGYLLADLISTCPPATEVAELYGGSGTFTLALAARRRKVTVYESDHRAVARARRNLAATGEGKVSLICGRVEGKKLPATITTIVVDPPRAGLAPVVRRQILESRAARLFYVSCNPATLARDLGTFLSEANGFRLDSLKAYDMYPGTTHLELLAQLSR